MAAEKSEDPIDYCKRFVLSCRDEAESGKKNRMDLNKANFDMYQLKHDFSHKKKGQSKEVLSKTRNATEQIKANFQQALADLDDWFRVTARDGSDGEAMLITPAEGQKVLGYMLKRADYFSHVGNSVQSGLLGSLAVSKVRGELIPKPRFRVKGNGKKGAAYKKNVEMIEDKTWELRFDIIRQENYYPDPSGTRLYEIEDSEVDLHVIKALSRGEDAIYDEAAVKDLKSWGDVDQLSEDRAEETGQNTPIRGLRPRVKITEFVGSIISQDGEVLHENCFITLANDDVVIRPPTPNPLWHQRSPYVAAAMIEVAHSVWGVAMMDAGTKHNAALIEIFNLILDSAMKAVWGISQIRIDALEDTTQIADGVPWGAQLKTNASLPVGGKVIEEVVTGQVPTDALNVFNLLTQETQTSMFTRKVCGP